jgi:hypothetical protein
MLELEKLNTAARAAYDRAKRARTMAEACRYYRDAERLARA